MSTSCLLLILLSAQFARAGIARSGIPPSLAARLSQPGAEAEFAQALSFQIGAVGNAAHSTSRLAGSLRREAWREPDVMTEAARAVVLESLALPKTALPLTVSALEKRERGEMAEALQRMSRRVAANGLEAIDALNELRRQSLPPGENLRSSTARVGEIIRLIFDGEKAEKPADLSDHVEAQIAAGYAGLLSEGQVARVNIDGYLRPLHFRKDTAALPMPPEPFLRVSVRVRDSEDAARTFNTLFRYYREQTGKEIVPALRQSTMGHDEDWDGVAELKTILTGILEGEVINHYGMMIFDYCQEAAAKLGMAKPGPTDLLLTISPHAGREEPYVTAQFLRALVRFGEMAVGAR